MDQEGTLFCVSRIDAGDEFIFPTQKEMLFYLLVRDQRPLSSGIFFPPIFSSRSKSPFPACCCCFALGRKRLVSLLEGGEGGEKEEEKNVILG